MKTLPGETPAAPISDVPDGGLLGDLAMLTKARLTALVVATTLFGFLLASENGVRWILLFHTLFGTALVAAGAAVLNQVMETAHDALMGRTKDRPLPAGRMTRPAACGVGLLLSVSGLGYLALLSHAGAALLAGVTWLVYLAVYTPMKRRSALNTLVGGISGAIPPVIGWVAAGGTLGREALFLFGLLFLWQMPHFLSINWIYRHEYETAGFVMWSNGDATGRRTAVLTMAFSALLLAWTAWAWIFGFMNLLYLAGALLLGAGFLVLATRFLRARTPEIARVLFFYSLLYLPLLLGLMLAGRT